MRQNDHESSKPNREWPQPPKAFTWRGFAIFMGLAVFAVVMGVFSVYMRRTQLEKTTAYWGPSAIESFQFGRRVELAKMESVTDSVPGSDATIELTDLPGLSHLRHAILEERHYVWPTGPGLADHPDETAQASSSPEEGWFFLRFEHPAGGKPTELIYDPISGAIGPAGKPPEVSLTTRANKGVSHYVRTLYRDLSKKIGQGPLRRGS